ncbi:MAG: TIGR03016 family PEP-CTERM system-associated outer membrane protein [Gammaproteobacteria bacterium]|nr:TIGR03016 family PEP-CTERM system-associated outer membrane protein [Gammaproteobacteria bacterium]MDH5652383.1 TIGR03016 family PEP-CTERM system-associated outer membrane protein [Gammaproteobacteria bacterium]
MAESELYRFTKKKYLLSIIFVAVICSYGEVYAINFVPRVVVSETYNDNVNLAPGNIAEEDYITQLNPGLNISSEGSRSQTQFDYRMQNIYYQNNSENDDTYHQATLNSKNELLNNRFFLDLNGSFSQKNLGTSDSISFDNLGVDERNRSNVTSYRITPYYMQKLGKFANLRLYNSDKVIDYEKNTSTVLDSNARESRLDVSNGDLFHKLQWRVSASRETTEYEGQTKETMFEDANLDVRYKVGPKTRVVIVRGYENNEYPTLLATDTKGAYWNAGITWSPTKRTHFEVLRGDRYFGNTNSLSFSHEKTNMYLNLSYKEDLSTASKYEFELIDAGGGNLALIPVATSEAFLSKSLQFKIDMKSRRSTLAFNVFRFIREYQDSDDTEQNRGASLQLRWKFADKTHLVLSEKWLYNTFRTSTRQDNVYDSKIGVEYQLDRNSFVEVTYGYLRRKSEHNQVSDPFDHNYERNILGANARFYF